MAAMTTATTLATKVGHRDGDNDDGDNDDNNIGKKLATLRYATLLFKL
jgi:hypothetical protein